VTRLSLRIVLTPLVASLLIIYLTRAMRFNRRMDYIKAGLVLGFGLRITSPRSIRVGLELERARAGKEKTVRDRATKIS
jgi:hypothetical protein